MLEGNKKEQGHGQSVKPFDELFREFFFSFWQGDEQLCHVSDR